MMSEGLAECEWISSVLESAVYHDFEPSLHRRKSISLPVEPTVTVMKADSHLQVDPSTVREPLYRCPFTEPFDGTRSTYGHSSGFTTDSLAPESTDFSVPTSLAICFNKFTVDGHVADRDCV